MNTCTITYNDLPLDLFIKEDYPINMNSPNG